MKIVLLNLLFVWFLLLSKSNEMIDVYSLSTEELDALKSTIEARISSEISGNLTDLGIPGGFL